MKTRMLHFDQLFGMQYDKHSKRYHPFLVNFIRDHKMFIHIDLKLQKPWTTLALLLLLKVVSNSIQWKNLPIYAISLQDAFVQTSAAAVLGYAEEGAKLQQK